MSGLELNCEQWPGFNLAKQITPSDARICTAISLLPRPQRPGTTGGEDGLASAQPLWQSYLSLSRCRR